MFTPIMALKCTEPHLRRLQPILEKGSCLIPCGGNKNPLIKAWPSSESLSLQQIADYPGVKAVGLRTGPEDGRILSVDLDGETAVKRVTEHNLNPFTGTFIVARHGDAFRLKLQFQLTPEQASEITPFRGKIHTKDAINGAKGEAVEVFYIRKRQVIVAGRHPSGEDYIWLDHCGPEALSAPDPKWWAFIKQCHHKATETPFASTQKSSLRNGTRRADPCPICGRHSGKGGSALWCSYTDRGLLFCMPGSTFSAPDGLRVGDVHNGWALKKITQTADGPVHVFGNHDPNKLKRQNDVDMD